MPGPARSLARSVGVSLATSALVAGATGAAVYAIGQTYLALVFLGVNVATLLLAAWQHRTVAAMLTRIPRRDLVISWILTVLYSASVIGLAWIGSVRLAVISICIVGMLSVVSLLLMVMLPPEDVDERADDQRGDDGDGPPR
jgi:hypothetical protein